MMKSFATVCASCIAKTCSIGWFTVLIVHLSYQYYRHTTNDIHYALGREVEGLTALKK